MSWVQNQALKNLENVQRKDAILNSDHWGACMSKCLKGVYDFFSPWNPSYSVHLELSYNLLYPICAACGSEHNFPIAYNPDTPDCGIIIALWTLFNAAHLHNIRVPQIKQEFTSHCEKQKYHYPYFTN